MSKSQSSLCQIDVVGLIPSLPYQKSIKCTMELYQHYPKIYLKPKFRGMLEFDWDEYLTKQRRTLGGQFWALLRPVAIYLDGEFIGSDEDLLDVINKRFLYSMPSHTSFYQQAMLRDYTRYLTAAQRTCVYLDINIDDQHVGKLVFQLYTDILPKTCYNFRCLCSGDCGPGKIYKGTRMHRIAKMGWLQGGDNQTITGGGGRSIYGATFADEGYISHDRRGVLSMANDGKHSNGSQFFVTLQPTLWMDLYYVAFGQLIEGVDVLKAIEQVEDKYEEPKKHIQIVDCGILFEPMSKAYWSKIRSFEPETIREKQRQESIKRRTIAEIKFRKSSVDLDLPSWREEVHDPRDLDSNMHIDRYIKGLYYLFDRPEQKKKFGVNMVEKSSKEMLENLSDDLVDNVGKYIMNEVFKSIDSATMLTEDTEKIVFSIVKNIVARATMYKDVVRTASELVDEIIAMAVAAVLEMLSEDSDSQIIHPSSSSNAGSKDAVENEYVDDSDRGYNEGDDKQLEEPESQYDIEEEVPSLIAESNKDDQQEVTDSEQPTTDSDYPESTDLQKDQDET